MGDGRIWRYGWRQGKKGKRVGGIYGGRKEGRNIGSRYGGREEGRKAGRENKRIG